MIINTKPLVAYIDSLLEEGIPYLDVVAHKDGKPLCRYFASRAGNAVGTEKLLLFSCTKPATVATALRLVELGLLSLDDPVEKYLPTYREVYLMRDGKRTAPKTRPTVRHLMTMTAGVSYDYESYPIKEAIENRGSASVTVAAMSSLPSKPLICEVGEAFNYSLCHDVLAALIEVAAGKPFSELMREHLLLPLEMHDTYFSREREEEIYDMFTFTPDGSVAPREKTNNFVFAEGYESGGAGLVSTVEDYIKFADMLALGGVGSNGVRVLSEESVRLMRTPVLASVSVGGNYTCVQGNEYGYGLGVRTRMIATEWGLPVGEFGWDGAAGSYLMVDPENKISVFVASHVRNWPRVLLGKHIEIVKRIYNGMN